MTNVVVVDMGLGNIRSLVSAMSYLGVKHCVADSCAALDDASHILLPGVGAFDAAMIRLNELSLVEPLREAVLSQHKPILGICLGMQLLCSSSAEGQLPGLQLIDGRFERLQADPSGDCKVPHVGFSEIHGYEPTDLFEGLGEQSFFYFTHSFALQATTGEGINTAYCRQGHEFVAAFQRGHVSGVQFHPEKSQASGLKLIRNFVVNSYSKN